MKYHLNLLRHIFLVSAATLIVSCDNFLEIEPLDSVSDQVTIVDKVSAETAVRGMYRSLAGNNYYGSSFQSIGYLSGDNIARTGPGTDPSQFINHEVTADNATVGSVWTAIYQTINRANHVIFKVPDVADIKLTESLKNQLVGEGYFVRALSYFDLARTWGGVQLALLPTESVTDKDGLKRSALNETYAQVLKDLDEAEKLLPETTNRIRATKKTVWALRARLHLYKKEWALAEEYASKIITDPNYKIAAPYNSFWANNVIASPESILETAYSNTNQNSHRNSWQPPENGGTRTWVPNSAFLDLINNPAIGGNRSVLAAKTVGGLWYGTMYYRSPSIDPSYVLRLAELILIRAEARAELGGAAKFQEAVADLNLIRVRAGIAPVAPADKAELLLAIENERRLEFAYEPHRWFDLVRTGRAAAVLKVTDANKTLLPVPIRELNADKALEQNPGY